VQETARVLVVEDEMLFAETLSGLLQDAGFEAAGPAGTIDSAMGVIETSTIDAAILDIRLYDELSYPVAYALRDRGIPFMFLTSYQTRDLRPTCGADRWWRSLLIRRCWSEGCERCCRQRRH